MKRILKWTGITLVVLLVVIQAVRPAKTNPAVDESRTIQAHSQITPEVTAILERACYDCHSNKTIWPWYSQVAPVSWLLVSDVNDGREAGTRARHRKPAARSVGSKSDRLKVTCRCRRSAR